MWYTNLHKAANSPERHAMQSREQILAALCQSNRSALEIFYLMGAADFLSRPHMTVVTSEKYFRKFERKLKKLHDQDRKASKKRRK